MSKLKWNYSQFWHNLDLIVTLKLLWPSQKTLNFDDRE